jgi:ABC-type antimicrobial peptide transport system permease subunit
MPLIYPVKRVFRSWKLFLALLIGIVLASTFFAGINVKANLAVRQVLDERLNGIYTDMQFTAFLNYSHPAAAAQDILSIEGVKDVEFFYRSYQASLLPNVNSTDPSYIPFAAVPNSYSVYRDMLGKPPEGMGANETYIVEGTPLADTLEVGDVIQTGFQFRTFNLGNTTDVYVNLTVAGFVKLTDKTYSQISGYSFYISPIINVNYPGQIYGVRPDILLVSWENTVQPLWSEMNDTSLETDFLVSVDRDTLLNPWDSEASVNNLRTVAENIQNTILGDFEHPVYVQSNLDYAMQSFQYSFPTLLLSFIVVSIPVFIVAWYIGSTVSDVSFNLRRREIGLLSTKGLSSGQIQRMFFTEALLIGLVGGLAGVVGGALLNQVYTGFNLETLFTPQTFNPYIVAFTVTFGVVLAFFSVFFSARRATSLPAVDALKEYMSIDAVKPYRKRWPWVAFILGTYKIILFLSGFNVTRFVISSTATGGGNFLTYLFLGPFQLFDGFLNIFGPLFFFWGFTKLFVQNSLKFQQLTSKVSRVAGDLGALAAKNVRRNPARSAAVAFLIALVIGYGVQVTVQFASEQDYVVRKIQYNVGADIVVSVVNATQAQTVLDDIVGNVSEVQYSTVEYQLAQPARQQYVQTEVKTVDPGSWLDTAYYEASWFSGNVKDAFNQLSADNLTIILERRVAKELNLNIGDEMSVDFPSGPRKLRIIAFFGPETVDVGSGFGSYALPTWSFVPRNLFNMSSPFSDAYQLEDFQTSILLRLNDGVNGTSVAEKIRDLNLEIYGVTCFDEELTKAEANPTSDNSLQILDVQRLGLIFAILAASVSIALISIVSMKERNREATLMSVKGLSYKQLVWMFLTENLAVVTFSVVLGVIVGLIAGYGTIASSSGVISELVQRRFVFTYDSLITVASFVSLIFASTILPIIVMSRQYVTKLERMIRVR